MGDVRDYSDEDEEDFNPPAEVASENGEEDPDGSAEAAIDQQEHDDAVNGENDEDDEIGERAGEADEDDDDEDEEDEEDAVTDRPRKRRRRDPMNQFIDVEAVVDEEEDEDEEEEEAERGFIQEEDEVDNLPVGAETDDRTHRAMDRRDQDLMQASAEETARKLQERYGRRERVVTDAALVPKRLLLPSIDDPSIYGVRVKPGKEREVVYSILKRVEERANTRKPLKIFSALERGGSMAGYVYVEARHKTDITEALDGIMFCYPHSEMTLLPIKEMPDILRVRKTESLQQGAYVRIKRGLYTGDLAQVDDVEANGIEASLRIVPRLDYGLNEDSKGSVEGQKRKRPGVSGLNRPPPRLFSEVEARKKYGANVETIPGWRRGFRYHNENYQNGFLIKDFKLQHIQIEDVHPTLEEVARFTSGAEDGTENLDLSALAASIKNSTKGDDFQAGDTIEVYEGEQRGVWGRAVAVRGDIVTLNVSEGPLKGQAIEVPVKGLRKRFREGDHVKVIGSSRFQGEVGLVVRIDEDKVTFLSDMSLKEITVFSKDLREATDTGATGSIGKYNLHDLVQLDGSTVAVIVKIERESMRVLDQFDSLRTVLPSQVADKIEKRKNAVATDRNGNEIRIDDTVKEVEGERRTGVIMHIHRAFVFLYNREQRENSGMFVARSTNVATIAAKGGRTTGQGGTGPDLARMNPALQRNGIGTPGANGMMAPPRSLGRDPVLGKTVKISKGDYKGLLGIVKETTDAHARVELHTKNRIVPVKKEFLRIEQGKDSFVPYHEFATRGRGRGPPSGAGGGSWGGRTPAAGGDAGGWGGRTPIGGRGMDGGRTPAWGAGSAGRVPVWGTSSGAATPGWGRSGGATSYGGGGAGGRTPAWQRDGGATSYGGGAAAGGRTPAGAGAWGGGTAYGGATAYASGGPSYGGATSYGGGTAYGGATYNAPDTAGGKTPAPAYDAPTPVAPTPGAPTPSFSGYGDTSTTNGGTSGVNWGGEDDDDDGPRYTD